MKRRDFLKAGIGGAFTLWGLAGAMQEAKAWAAKGRESLPRGRKIDIHAHAILPSFVQGLKKLGIDAAAEEGYPLPSWSEEAHLDFMRQAHIDYTVLQQLYYDLAGDPLPEAMDMLLKITDVSHLLYGSDFPYVPAKVLLGKKTGLDEELAQREWLAKIYCQNSQELINL